MKDETNEPLSDKERGLFAALRDAPEPDARLELQTLREARRAGMIAPNARTGSLRVPVWWIAAAALVGLLAGFLWSNASRTGTAPGGRQYLLLLRSSAQMAALSQDENRRVAREYGEWAQLLGDEIEGGEELVPEGRMLLPQARAVGTAAGSGDVGGYFLIRTSSTLRAEEIAATCPHLTYGGAIELREIVER
jgi:hypothetical protein